MDAAPPSLMASSTSRLLPKENLLDSLVQICHEVASMEELPFVQVKNIRTMIRRIKLLSSLFEEIQEGNKPLPPSSILCLAELFSVIQKVKFLIVNCKEGSCLWILLQTDFVSEQFHAIMNEMGRALDILPLSLFSITADTREQVELLHKQGKRVQLFMDPLELQTRAELLHLMASKNEKSGREKGFTDFRTMKEILNKIGLRSTFDYDEEISKLEAEARKQAGTGGPIVVSNINNLVSLISLSKSNVFTDTNEENLKPEEIIECTSIMSKHHDQSSSSQSIVFNIPDEFRCSISLDLMKDPVIVASGHTYDRHSIAQWINSGHHTCPKSGQRLIHMALIPNYALKSLIQQWCEENNIPMMGSKSSSSVSERSSSKRKLCEDAIDHISATKVVVDAVKMTAEFLVGKLATGSPDIQRQAAYELRLLAKTGMDNRRIIAEAGAIPFLVTLLGSQDSRIQENSVTALLNLSIYDNNKLLIMAAGAIDNIIDVLRSGKSMEARENAAAAIFSLSMIDDYKVVIGARPRAISALVALLGEGSSTGKRDAAAALYNLSLYHVNKASVVLAGAISLLIDLLMDDKAGITDDALAMLALLSGCSQGLEELRKSKLLVPLLIDLLRFGSPKGKEHSMSVLLVLCKNGGDEVVRTLLMNPWSIPSIQSLASDGSLRAQRKADALLRLLNRCCSQTCNTVG